jgi:hypothetical protein
MPSTPFFSQIIHFLPGIPSPSFSKMTVLVMPHRFVFVKNAT